MRYEELLETIKCHTRIAVVGHPESGKTTLSTRISQDLLLPCIHADDYINHTWGNIPTVLGIAALANPRHIIEGCQVARALSHQKILPEAVIWVLTLDGVKPQHRKLDKVITNAMEKWQATSPATPVYHLLREKL